MSHAEAVQGVSSSQQASGNDQSAYDEIAAYQVQQDIQYLIQQLENTEHGGKLSSQKISEKILTEISHNIQHQLQTHPHAFNTHVKKELEHLAKILSEKSEQLTDYFQQIDNNPAMQVNLVNSVNTNNPQEDAEKQIQSVGHIDNTQNTSNYFDPHHYHELLTSIQDQINNPILY